METNVSEISINGVSYVPKGSAPTPVTGSRVVVVVDRGWIFAGDLEEKDGRIFLHRPVWIFRWESVGFDGVIKDPKSSKVTLKKLENVVDIPKESEIFRVPVSQDWGL